jgi:PAT family beta-lactamase induction signal transducer AmpG
MTDVAKPAAKTRGFAESLAVFLERRSLVMLGLGFSSGLPFLLIFDTLSAWLREAGLTLEVIAFFALATLSYSLKFIWAPLVDRAVIPVLGPLLGQRRSWLVLAQGVIIFGLWMISGSNPAEDLGRIALFAVMVGFFGATQDISMDAWRIESVDVTRQGAMAAAYQWGYRIAFIVAGAAPLYLADIYNWNISYAAMAALMGIGVAAALLAPREKEAIKRPLPTGAPSRPALEWVEWIARIVLIAVAALVIGTGLTGQPNLMVGVLGLSPEAAERFTATYTDKEVGPFLQFAAVLAGFALLVLACVPLPGFKTRPGLYLAASFGLPLKDFFQRFGKTAGLILALICLYRLADFVLNLMNPFYLDLGFTKPQIADVRKIFGVVASTIGIFMGGWAVAKLGLIRTMVIGAFASPVSNLVFAWLATQGPDLSALFVAIGVDNFCTGFAGTALIAYMSSLTSAGFTATQYALFTSLYALPGKLTASQSGRIVETAARAAEPGGPFSALLPLMRGLPSGSLASGAATAGVSPAALGAGYIVFFLYSALLGVGAIILAFIVADRHFDALEEAKASDAVDRTADTAAEPPSGAH